MKVRGAVILLGVLLGACTGLSDKPVIVATIPPPQSVAQASVGERIFADRCASCHGMDGRGGGAVALSANLQTPDFTDPTTRQATTF